MAEYRTLYAHLITGAILGELPVQSFSVEWALNSPGSFQATLPLRMAEQSSKLSDQVASPELDLEGHGIALYVERDGVIIWAGHLVGIEANVDQDVLTVRGAGFQDLLRHRLIRDDISYAGVDQFAIAAGLIDHTQGKPGGDLSIDTSPLTGNPSGVLRTRTFYGFERATVADRIEQLAAVQDGFDFRLSARWEGGGVVRYVEASYPPTGRMTNNVFDIGANVALLSYTSDLTTMTNWCDALGTGDGPTKLVAAAVDTPRLTAWGLRESVESRTSVLDFDTLFGHARRRVIEGRFPNRQLSLQVYADTVPVFGSYVEGDVVRVEGSHGYLDLEDFYRVTTRTLSVGDDGTEVVNISAATWRLYTDG